MRVFISWSGDRSKELAEYLAAWLRRVLQNVEPWMSKHSIERGKLWGRELTAALETIDVGIICVTRENKDKPWILFEAGALAKKGESRVMPYLLDESPEDIPAPLQMFNAVKVTKDDTLLMLQSINVALAGLKLNLTDDDLKVVFEKWWPDLDEAIKKIPKSPVDPPPPPTPDQALEQVNARLGRLMGLVENLSRGIEGRLLPDEEREIVLSKKLQERREKQRSLELLRERQESIVQSAARTEVNLRNLQAAKSDSDELKQEIQALRREYERVSVEIHGIESSS